MMDVEETVPAPVGTSRGRRLVSVLLGVLFVGCFLAFVAALVVRTQLLDAELYIQALTGTNAYERIYTEVLADPGMQDLFKERVGSSLDLVVEELYAQLVAAGVLVLPPSEIQAATETVIHRVVGYIRGDSPTLEATVQPGNVIDREALSRRIQAAIVSAASQRLASAVPAAPAEAVAPDEPALRAYLSDLASGKLRALPENVGRASVAKLSAAERERLVGVLLERAGTVSEQDRLQVEASLASGDLASAVAAASLHVLKPRVEKAVAALLDRSAPDGAVDGLALAGDALGETRSEVVGLLNRARSAASLAQLAIVPLVLLMLALLVAIVWLNGHELRAMLASAGWTLTAAGGLALALWLVATGALKSMATARLETSLGQVPGLQHWVADILGAVTGQVLSSILWLTLLWLAVGILSLVFAYSASLSARFRDWLAPVWPHRRWLFAGLFGLVVVLPLLGRVVTARQLAANPPCNGHAELCDRPLNEVVFAASHNAMSITEYGWLWPMHDGTVTDQLEAGVRALLIDTHYQDDTTGEADFLDSLSPAEREVAEKAMANFKASGLLGAVLCHQSCRLGESSFGTMLEELKAFLDAHPREVVMLVIQDEISADDTGNEIAKQGLEPYIYTHRDGEAWPTLRRMIDANQRLVVMAENEGPPPDWYTNAWDVTEETPYTFVFKESFSCEPNRGGTGKPFFLLNHWIQRIAPNRADAAVVNAYDFLLGRARQCQAERGKLPNLIAVNYYGQGDLFRVVDTLNRVGEPSGRP